MISENGLVDAYILDGKGGGKAIGWNEIQQWIPENGLLWVHLDYAGDSSQQWLYRQSGLDEILCEALLAEETRPRIMEVGDGLLVILRGVNLNPGADPEDMVSIRLWLTEDRIVSTRKRRLLSVDQMREDIARGYGPKTTSEFIVTLTTYLVERMAKVIDDINDQVDSLEGEVLIAESHQLRIRLLAVRREIVILRRYLAPQRDAMSRLLTERVSWLYDKDRRFLREIADRATRYIEDLDAARERAAFTHEEIVSRLSERMEKRMYVISMVATIFLPLGFLTGLLGINVGGIPGSENSEGFLMVCIGLFLAAGAMIGIFKWRKWL